MQKFSKYILTGLFVFSGALLACGGPSDPLPGGGGGDAPPEGWAELPVMQPADGGEGHLRYVTHYVSADGMSASDTGTSGVSGASKASKASRASGVSGRVRSYTIAFDSSTRQPLWVAYPMHSWYDGDAGRGTTWRPDPLIPESEQPYLRTSYNEVGNNGAFSRGHMLASDSRQRSRAMNDQTFLFTNSAPQAQNTFNGGVWLKLENLEKEWGFRGIAARDTLYVVTGSTFGGLTGEGGASEGGSSGADMGGGSDGGGEKITSDDRGNTIPVPTHFYKAMLTTKGSGVGKAIGQCSAAELKCVVFYLEHFGHAGSARPSTDHMMSVADLEAAIGIEFFPTIAPAARSVKLSFDPAEWAGVAQSN